jgi:hypothetical protein
MTAGIELKHLHASTLALLLFNTCCQSEIKVLTAIEFIYVRTGTQVTQNRLARNVSHKW